MQQRYRRYGNNTSRLKCFTGDNEQSPCDTVSPDEIEQCQPDPEPCDTGNPVIDDPGIQQGLKNIWEASNPNETQTNRKEQGGWIIKTDNGFKFQAFPNEWPATACGIAPPVNGAILDLPENTVGWVHTHPYEVGDDITEICGLDKK